MRRALKLGIAVLLFASGVELEPVEAAEGRRSTAHANDDKDGVVITNPGGSSPGEPAGKTRRVRRQGSSRPLPEYVVERVYLRDGGAPDRCVATTTARRDTPINQIEELDNEVMRLSAERDGIPNCSDMQAKATPALVAEAFLRRIPLPEPEPAIAPDGQAITGLAAFLETNGALTHAIGPEATPLGPVSVEAQGEYFVDWGDGSPEAGPFAFEGEAYPSGRIFHHYRWTGNYTVTLRTNWSATWRLGGDSGTVEGLRTETTTPVEVFEVQAVIRR